MRASTGAWRPNIRAGGEPGGAAAETRDRVERRLGVEEIDKSGAAGGGSGLGVWRGAGRTLSRGASGGGRDKELRKEVGTGEPVGGEKTAEGGAPARETTVANGPTRRLAKMRGCCSVCVGGRAHGPVLAYCLSVSPAQPI